MNKVLLLISGFFSITLSAQVGPRAWQDHTSINSCNSVAKLGSKIYASYYNGLIRFEEDERSPQTLNKINGLSDVGIRLLRTNPYNNKLLVIYENCNIDVIDVNGSLRNYTDFKLKTLSGKKIVNEVTFYKQYAYLACGFGIVVFDTEKLEIKDTYIIGANGTEMDIYQIALNDSLIFAATPVGMYSSNYKKKILNNYNSWKLEKVNLPLGPYCGVVNVAGNILACYSPFKENLENIGKDTIYILENNAWKKYPPLANEGSTIQKFSAISGNLFSYVDFFGLVVRDISNGTLVNVFNTFEGDTRPVIVKDAYMGVDQSGYVSYWIADNTFGLYQSYYYYLPRNVVRRNGTNGRRIGNIDVFNGRVGVSPSYIDNAGIGNYTTEGVNLLTQNVWSYMELKDFNGQPIRDVTSILIDRKDSTRFWACSWAYGVMAYRNNKLSAVYTPANTSMPVMAGDDKPRCQGLSMDGDGNLWFAQSDQKNYLTVIKRNGQLKSFSFPTATFTRKTFVDKNNFVWVLHEREGGLTVFKNQNFADPVLGVNYRVLNKDVGNGNLESNAVYSIAQDKDGKIWVGTALGIKVFYNPSAMFTSSDFDAQPIKIIQDGNVELLLGKEIVTAIAVDGANNKWVGTQDGGVYCFSPDGITQLYHFTVDNSPLYSNTVIDINYNEVSGDVFIGTDQGLQSFRSIIVEGSEDYSSIYAYPNPVKPNYQGTVLVRGLVDNSIVKIVDESGNMVWETKSTGGQIEWPVKNLGGARVTSGVYVVYASTTNGELKALTKVLVVN